jgi:FixJ family two-component response regulator
MRGDEKKAMTAGCCDYITKPIDTRTFFKQIAAAIQASGTA